MIHDVLVVPMPRVLLPPVSAEDPVADLRAACSAAVGSFLADSAGDVVVLAPPVGEANRRRGVTDPLGHRVARHLLAGHDVAAEELVAGPDAATALLGRDTRTSLLVTADGSACRGEKAPGHLDPRAVPFDDALEAALRDGDAATLAALDEGLAAELWCEGAPALRVLGEVARGRTVTASLEHAGAPYGVAWWVARWRLA